MTSAGAQVAAGSASAASALASGCARMRSALSSSASSAVSSAARVRSALASCAGTYTARVEVRVGKLPHFSMSGKFDAETGSVPTVNVSWYSGGGVFRPGEATLFGAGDAPTTEYMLTEGHLRQIAGLMDGELGGDTELLAEVRSLHRDVANLKVYLDKRKLVGAIASDMDRELGSMARLRGSMA